MTSSITTTASGELKITGHCVVCNAPVEITGGNPEKQGISLEKAIAFLEKRIANKKCERCLEIEAMEHEASIDNACAGPQLLTALTEAAQNLATVPTTKE